MLCYYVKKRFRINEINIEDNCLKVEHKNEIIDIQDVDLEDFFYETSRKKEFINELLDIDSGYCPSFLSNIIKSLRKKELNFEEDGVYDKFNKEIKDKWLFYLSIYKEDELVDIILKSGKSIWNIVKFHKKQIFTPIVNCKGSYDEFKDALLKSNKKKLSKIIDGEIQRIGVPYPYPSMCEGFDWIGYLYICMLLYLAKAIYRKELLPDDIIGTDNVRIYNKDFGLIHYIMSLLDKVFENIKYTDGKCCLKTPTNIKEAINIYFALPFVYYYIKNYYGECSEEYAFFEADHLTDVLEEHREYLISRTRDKEKRKRINAYSYEMLEKSYNRKRFKN